MRIIRIGTARKDARVRIVHLSEGPPLRLEASLVEELGLVAGQGVDAGLRERLHASAERRDCLQRALRLLAVRPRTEQELRNRLVRADFSSSAIDSTISGLLKDGLLDDDAFARAFSEERRRNRGQAPARIEAELRRRGVERETAHRAAWGAYEDPGRDPGALLLDEAIGLLSRRAGRYSGLDAHVARRRMAGLLGRAGYPTGVVLDAVESRVERMLADGLLKDPQEDGQ